MNKPYVKQYDENGICINKVDKYVSEFPNRSVRKRKEARFIKNGKNNHLTIIGGKTEPKQAYKRILQVEKDKNGLTKNIEHYVLKTK